MFSRKCENKVHANGMCNMHLIRIKKHGSVDVVLHRYDNITAEQRFWAKVNLQGGINNYAPDLGECYLWTGSINENGYGWFWINGKTKKAHRVSWEFENGQIPHHMQLDHLCRVRNCVRPSHLEVVTNQENTIRGAVSKKYLRNPNKKFGGSRRK